MTRSRPSLKNSARPGLLVNILFAFALFLGCSSSTAPTYLIENIPSAIEDICKNEYAIDVKARLIGRTLWVYLPVEDIFVKSEKPEKSYERFDFKKSGAELQEGVLKVEYLIRSIPEKEKTQDFKYNKSVLEKINNVWKSLRRVLFSMERSNENEPLFFYLVTADIKNGIETKDLFYYPDLKKVSYDFISWGEYQHRTVQDAQVSADIIGDREGDHLTYHDVTMEDFITRQILHRIKLKFQKPEVEREADIDKEILKVVTYTLRIYGFKDFSALELSNLVTQNKILLNQSAVWAEPTD